MNLLVILSKEHKKMLGPLMQIWEAKKFEVQCRFYNKTDVPALNLIKSYAENCDAVMMLTPANRAASTLVNGPLLTIRGKKIPIAIVPVSHTEDLKQFVKTAVEIHQRSGVNDSVTLLAQRLPRYLKVTERIFNDLKNSSSAIETFKWTSDVVYPGDMLYGINKGASVSIYMGHGRALGWAGYYGVRARHFEESKDKPSAAIISLCCQTASRKNIKFSFCESLMLSGVSSATFGAIKPTLFTDNTRWAINLSKALQNGVSTIGELIATACPVHSKASDAYRLFGDPTAPLLSDDQFCIEARKIKTYEC